MASRSTEPGVDDDGLHKSSQPSVAVPHTADTPVKSGEVSGTAAAAAPNGLAEMLWRCFGQQGGEMDAALRARSRLEGAARAAFERWEAALTRREIEFCTVLFVQLAADLTPFEWL